jgi:CRISPR/Cas system-associated exonuclease Cas4 (RecB family)
MQGLAEKIYKSYEEAEKKTPPRRHLGASIIGDKCERKLWYTFRGVDKEPFDGRVLRLFETGQLEENRLIRNLRAVGCKVIERDKYTGQQFRVVAVMGHFGGSMDAIVEIDGVWYVAEFKTHSQKSFDQVKKHGVQKSKSVHYGQMQVYMLLEGIDKGLYLAVNKNTDELYIEYVDVNLKFGQALIEKAESVITATSPPSKISERADWYECKFCDFRNVCHKETIPAASCLTCCHATPVEDAKWSCGKRDIEKKLDGCDNHLYIPELMTHSEAVSSDDGEVHYVTNKNKKMWVNGPSGFNSKQLHKMEVWAIEDENVQKIAEIFQ